MPYDDLSVQKIETMLGAKTKDQALRLLTARDHYPLRLFRYFLEQSTSEEINRCGEDSKKTALHWAYEKGALKKAKLLIENGAREDLQDKDGKTPKMLFKG